jgi:hypothetical protein
MRWWCSHRMRSSLKYLRPKSLAMLNDGCDPPAKQALPITNETQDVLMWYLIILIIILLGFVSIIPPRVHPDAHIFPSNAQPKYARTVC